MSTDAARDHFSLFGLPRRFRIDPARLDAAWKQAAAAVHPDRYAHAPAAERRVALMQATRINEAYQTLKSPVDRARYLLQLSGVDTQEETNTSMPADFLMAQMEWRETLEDSRAARDVDALEALSRTRHEEACALTEALAIRIDDTPDLPAAALLVRKLRFLEKLEQDIGDAIDAILD